MSRTVRVRAVAAVLVALLAVTAGCSGAAGGGDSASVSRDGGGSGGAADAAAEAEERVESGDGGNGGAGGTLQVRQRAIIRNGQITVEVDEFERTEGNLTALVEQHGGFVSDTSVERNYIDENTSYRTGTVVLRVPQDNFSTVFDRIGREGEVLRSSTNSEDVTDQLVDIEARLNNLRAQRDRLRTLYEQANDTETVLQVERRLSEVQTEIERLEAQRESLQRRVALSTIRVEIREERPDRPLPDEWYDISVVTAFLESVNGVVVVARALIVLTAYALPYLLAFGLPFVGVVGGVVAWYRGWGPFKGRRTVVPDAPDDLDDPDEAAGGADDSATGGDDSIDGDDADAEDGADAEDDADAEDGADAEDDADAEDGANVEDASDGNDAPRDAETEVTDADAGSADDEHTTEET